MPWKVLVWRVHSPFHPIVVGEAETELEATRLLNEYLLRESLFVFEAKVVNESNSKT